MAGALRPGWEVRFADCAGAARAILAEEEMDLVLIDIGLPDEDGFALLASIASKHPQLSQLVISGRSDAAVRVRARSCGAQGFIAKTMPSEGILAAIDTVLAGGAAFDDAKPNGSPTPQLTARQAQILELLAEGHGNKEIRHRLGIAERTVRAHLTELFQLLEAHSRMQALIRARELGLVP